MFQTIRKQGGFSIIEIMVSFFIIALAVVGLMGAFPYGLSMNKSSEQATTAAFLAEEKMEELISLDYTGIGLGVIEAKHRLSADETDDLYDFFRETEVDFVDGNLNESLSDLKLKKVSVRIFYNDSIGRQELKYEINSLVSKY